MKMEILQNIKRCIDDYLMRDYDEKFIRHMIAVTNDSNFTGLILHSLNHPDFCKGKVLINIFSNYKHLIKLEDIVTLLHKIPNLSNRIIRYYSTKLRISDILLSYSINPTIYNKYPELFEHNKIKSNVNEFLQEIKIITVGSRGEDRLLNILVEFYNPKSIDLYQWELYR